MPKAFSDHEKAVIRAQLREKGRAIFEVYGLRKTSVDELTAAVGISKGAFYLFYASKEELFMEILEQIEEDIQQRILALSIHGGEDAQQQIREILQRMLLTWDDYPLLKSFSQADFDYLVRKIPAERVAAHANHDELFITRMITLIEQTDVPVRASPRIVSNLIKSLFFLGLHRDTFPPNDYSECMTVLIALVARYMTEDTL